MLKPLKFSQIDEEEMIIRSSSFLTQMKTRRSVREFSDRTIPFEVVKNVVMTASSAPSGANKQPWTFVIVNDPEIKRKIRLAAEKEEKEFYDHRAPEEWLEDLEPLGTDWHKPFLESAPYRHSQRGTGSPYTHAQPYGVPIRNPKSAGQRKTVPADSSGLSRG